MDKTLECMSSSPEGHDGDPAGLHMCGLKPNHDGDCKCIAKDCPVPPWPKVASSE